MIPGLGYGVNRLTRWVCKEFGASEETAKWVGIAVGTAVAVAIVDVASLAAEGGAAIAGEAVGSAVDGAASVAGSHLDVAANVGVTWHSR
jgi:hypothetical protein